jgi:hypothetical protein
MIPSEFITGQSLIVFGLTVVAFIFLMRRTFLRPRGLTGCDRSPTDKADVESAQLSAETVVEKLEVRLFDFAREVEGRMHSRIAVLDRLIVDADSEILRLQDLLAATKGVGGRGAASEAFVDLPSTGTKDGTRSPERQPDILLPRPSNEGGQREAA